MGAGGPGAAAAPHGTTPDERRVTRFVTWDLNLEGGVGYSFAGQGEVAGFGRVRGGLLLVDSSDLSAPMFYSLGFFADGASVEHGVTYGVQGEVLSLNSGFWAQVGAGVDVAPRPVVLGSVGWSVFGVEAQGRFDPDAGAYAVLFGKLRIPIGIVQAATR